MDPETLFSIASSAVMPGWLLLAVAPAWPWTHRFVHLVAVALVAVYLSGMFLGPPPPEGGNFSTLAGVMALFTSPWGVLSGWVHYLIFDLFIGAWEVRDAQRRGIHHALVVPCLFLTLMLGPVGLGLYLLLRLALRREPDLEEAPV